jgi:hypothetical protein
MEKVQPQINHLFNTVSHENLHKCVKIQDVSLLEILPSIELKELGYMNRISVPHYPKTIRHNTKGSMFDHL